MVIKNFICNIHRTFAPDISSVCLYALCIRCRRMMCFRELIYRQTTIKHTFIMKSIQNKGINLTAEDLKIESLTEKNDMPSSRYDARNWNKPWRTPAMTSSNWSIPLHRWNVPPSAPAMLPHSLPVLSPASVSLASLPVFPVFRPPSAPLAP